MAYEEILTVNSSIQSKRTTKTTANSSTEVLKDGELLIVRDGNNPPNLRAGDGTTQIKNLKDMVPGVASTSTAGLLILHWLVRLILPIPMLIYQPLAEL